MIDVKEIGKQIGEQIVKEPMMCWYPGGFKPPHKGHFAAAQQLASKPYITQVNVLIGQGIRDGITAEQSKAIWDIYLKAQPNPKIKVAISQTKSPIRDIYRWFADDLERKAYVAAAGKEATDLKYFENLKEAFGDRVFEEIINDEFVDQDGERVSGTEFRATINRLKETYNAVKANPEDKRALNDYNTTYNYFKSLFPESVIQKGYFDEIQKVLGINYPPPTSLQEDSQPNPKNQPKWVWLEYKNKEKLNPLIFDEDETIDEKVKELLLKIANYFWENLEIPEPFEDVVLIGSSANYNYTPTSDIDVHIIVDFNKFKDPELVKKYFDKAKANWNKVHDLKLGKHNIELYVQDKNEEKTADAGIYSLMNDKWIYKPTYKPINIPNKDIEQKTKLFKQQINKLVKQGKDNPEKSIELINKIKERIKNFRQAGLDKAGEYSIENLAFKNLRNTGYLKKLSDLKNQLIDKSLSLTESIDKNSLFNNFMSYACNELQIQTPPTLEIKHMVGEEQPSFGAYLPSDHHIFLNPIGRNIVDVLRTLAHELVHAKQNELGILTPTSGETGSEHENDANAIAGILMRDYGKQNPDIYNIGVLQEQVTKTSVICDKCGWSWKKKDGGKDLYVCHKCGHDNNPKLNEVKKNLNENVAGIDNFLNKTIQKFPETEKYKDTIEKFIESSGVKKIELSNFSFGYDNALGLSLHDGVLLNNKIFNLNLPTFLYVVFHELAHQYQFKKYGDDKMYDLYRGKIDVKEAAAAMKNIELIADEFAVRKIREFIKLGLLNKEDEIKNPVYKNIPLSHFEQLINLFAKKLKTKGAKNPDEISDVIYNTVKANLIKNVFDKIKGMLQESKKDKQQITRIYFDLDGVLAGFDNQFKKYNKDGLDFKSYIREHGSNKAWDIINKAKTKFWSEMPWNPGGKELYNRVMELAKEKNIEVWILSSPGLDPNGDAKKGKDEWVDKHLNIPKNRRVYKQAKDKHTEAKPGYMLIDDMGKNVSEFINAGGTGIKNNPEDSTESIKKLYKFKYE